MSILRIVRIHFENARPFDLGYSQNMAWRCFTALLAAAPLTMSLSGPWTWAAEPSEPPVAPSSVGSARITDAEVLWNDARSAFENSRHDRAVIPLQRLIERYPATPHYTEAHRLLGAAFLQKGQPARAIRPLRYFTDAKNMAPEANTGRLLLARAYLDLKKGHEAFLTATEVVRATSATGFKDPKGPVWLAEALLLKSEALLLLNRHLESEASIADARSALSKLTDPGILRPLQAQLASVSLRHRNEVCKRLPGRGKMNEGQARDQYLRRGTCLVEAALEYKFTLQAENPYWSKRAAADLIEGFRLYARACSEPPLPPGRRTAAQKKRYRVELAQLLQGDFEAKRAQLLDFINTWKEELHRTTDPEINSLVQQLTDIRP